MKRLLLLSNSKNHGEEYLAWAKNYVNEFLEGIDDNILFIPYAGVTISWDDYYEKVQEVLTEFGKQMDSIHHFQDPIKAVQQAKAILVGGGNTFQLFGLCQKQGIFSPIRKKIEEGVPYIGWSAGSNLACPKLSTTNDMPVYEPPSFDGLSIVPFQINPHYTNLTIEGHGGESRNDRLKEYMALNPQMNILCLREASMLELIGDKYSIKGEHDAIMMKNNEIQNWSRGDERVY